jgi:MYXO-CTERM domain-containing protein
MVLTLAPLRADASFHLWRIKEIFSNADGSIQFIELFCDTAGQGFLSGHTLTASDGTTTRTFTFPSNVAESTNKHLLLATPGFVNLPGAVPPDYILPCGPFFPPNASQIMIDFAGFDAVMFAGATLPKDGVHSLTDSNLTANVAALVSGTNSPTNVSSAAGSVTLTTGQTNGTESACSDTLYCNGPETCTAGACADAVDPCANGCVEATDTCLECTIDAHCNDNNPCTDDTCDGANTCQHAAHTGSCDDGMFCNGADTCSGTTCTHAGDPCAGINCNEGPDTCANCTGAADCEDGEPCTVDTCTTGQCNRATAADGAECDTDTTYCNGVGACTGGVCGGNAAPCDPMTETCEEASDSCTPVDAIQPDAPDMINPLKDDEGGCCQANTTPATFTGPGLVLLLGLAFGRRRRRR